MNETIDNALIRGLEQRIPELMKEAIVPGLSIALIRNAQILWSQGFGIKNTKTKEAVSTDTVFEAASLSKPVFAYAVLKIYEKGELDLDTPLSKYLPDPYIPDDPRLKLITARTVLSHTSGLPNWRRKGQPLKLHFTPQEKFGYSGEGYVYLQRAVEHKFSQSLNEYMKRNVFEPLSMNDSSYVWTDTYEKNAATGHDKKGKPSKKWKPTATEASSAATLHTTVLDFAKFLIQTMMPGTNNSFQLREQTIAQMLSPQVKLNDSLSWGLGWGLEHTNNGDFFWHWGDNIVFQNFVIASREQRTGLVILTNSANGLNICEEIVHKSIGGEHPAFRFLDDFQSYLA